MNERLLRIADRIFSELEELDRTVQRINEGWHKFQQFSDDLYLDGVALNLHSFYNGIERLFELIATAIDGVIPQGSNWHQILLEQMTNEVPGIRPAVISEKTYEALDEYRGFRHVVRNIYAFQLDTMRIRNLVESLQSVFTLIRSELLAFANFLKQ